MLVFLWSSFPCAIFEVDQLLKLFFVDMEFHGGGSGGVVVSGSNVPAFLTKLWTLIEDPDTDPLICWSPVS